jgi:hypothetical protein
VAIFDTFYYASKNEGTYIQMDDKNEFTLSFEGLDGAEGNNAAQSLKDTIVDLGERDLSVTIKKDRESTQDFGATLVLVLGTQAAIAIASGIAAWMRRRADMTTVIIRDKHGNEVLKYNGEAKYLDKLIAVLKATR